MFTSQRETTCSFRHPAVTSSASPYPDQTDSQLLPLGDLDWVMAGKPKTAEETAASFDKRYGGLKKRKRVYDSWQTNGYSLIRMMLFDEPIF